MLVLVADASRAARRQASSRELKFQGATATIPRTTPWGWSKTLGPVRPVSGSGTPAPPARSEAGCRLSRKAMCPGEHWIVVSGRRKSRLTRRLSLNQREPIVYNSARGRSPDGDPGSANGSDYEVQTGAYLGEDDMLL